MASRSAARTSVCACPASSAVHGAIVRVAVASEGLARHVKSLMRELLMEPVFVDRLPDEAELAGCRLLLVDAPLLQGIALRPWAEAQRRARRSGGLWAGRGG